MKSLLPSTLFFALIIQGFTSAYASPVVVGSKLFTESYILGEIAAQTIEKKSSVEVVRKLGMGSTGILFEALKSGSIDVYPDYTGTLAEAILKKSELKSVEAIQTALGPLNLVISKPLGFNNTYALAVKESFAREHGLKSISDLVGIVGELKAAFSYEFMDRYDGYRGLVARYRLPMKPKNVIRMEHSLAFQAIDDGAVNLIEVYSTDAKIEKLKLRVLTDDLNYFPSYQAVWVATQKFVDTHPKEWQLLTQLNGSISAVSMLHMNARADIDKVSFSQVASAHLGEEVVQKNEWLLKLSQRTSEHLFLVMIALLFSIIIGVPLGLLAARYTMAGHAILLVSGLVQTIPSLALLCFLIPLFGVGVRPALVALCLYSLLPVVMNTFIGIRSIEAKYLENAHAFGMNRLQVLFRIVLPMASPTLLAGIKTATIVSIGTATLAALVGAGGYGAEIVTGLALNDIPTILRGAIPAAVMALIAHALFELLNAILIPNGLKQRRP
jgi:osmoprotectant transport system permease protein